MQVDNRYVAGVHSWENEKRVSKEIVAAVQLMLQVYIPGKRWYLQVYTRCAFLSDRWSWKYLQVYIPKKESAGVSYWKVCSCIPGVHSRRKVTVKKGLSKGNYCSWVSGVHFWENENSRCVAIWATDVHSWESDRWKKYPQVYISRNVGKEFWRKYLQVGSKCTTGVHSSRKVTVGKGFLWRKYPQVYTRCTFLRRDKVPTVFPMNFWSGKCCRCLQRWITFNVNFWK